MHVAGLVNQELLLQNESLTAENRILRAQLPPLRPLRGAILSLALAGSARKQGVGTKRRRDEVSSIHISLQVNNKRSAGG